MSESDANVIFDVALFIAPFVIWIAWSALTRSRVPERNLVDGLIREGNIKKCLNDPPVVPRPPAPRPQRALDDGARHYLDFHWMILLSALGKCRDSFECESDKLYFTREMDALRKAVGIKYDENGEPYK